MDDKYFLKKAYEQAKKSYDEGGIPIGSVIVNNGEIIGAGHNQRIQKGSPILHGEMDAFENAGRVKASVYKNSVLYTTLSPCPMCSGTILLYGIKKVVIGENKNFLGSEELLKKNGVEVLVLDDKNCIFLMEKFIKEKPEIWNEDIGV